MLNHADGAYVGSLRIPVLVLLLIAAAGAQAGEPRRLGVTVLGGWSPLEVNGTVTDDVGCCHRVRQGQTLHRSALAAVVLDYRLAPLTAVELAVSAAPWHQRERSTRTSIEATHVREECNVAPPRPAGCIGPLGIYGMYGAGAHGEGRLTSYRANVAVRRELGGEWTRGFLTLGLGRVVYAGARDGLRDAWSLQLGGGVLARVAPRAWLRIDVTDHILRRHFIGEGTAHDVHVRVGVALH